MASIVLLLNDVKKECLNYIEQTIDIENFMTIKCIADKNKIRDVHELVLSYILKNYKWVYFILLIILSHYYYILINSYLITLFWK